MYLERAHPAFLTTLVVLVFNSSLNFTEGDYLYRSYESIFFFNNALSRQSGKQDYSLLLMDY